MEGGACITSPSDATGLVSVMLETRVQVHISTSNAACREMLVFLAGFIIPLHITFHSALSQEAWQSEEVEGSADVSWKALDRLLPRNPLWMAKTCLLEGGG